MRRSRTKKLEAELRRLDAALASTAADQDQAGAARQDAEALRDSLPAIEAQVRLGELSAEEGDARRNEILARVSEAQEAHERVSGALVELRRRAAAIARDLVAWATPAVTGSARGHSPEVNPCAERRAGRILQDRAPVLFDPWQAVGMMQRLRARGVRTEEFTFSAASVGRLASTLHLLLKNGALALPDDEELLDELRALRLVETSPGVVRVAHDPDRHDDRAIALAIAAQRIVAEPVGPPSRATVGAPPERPIAWQVSGCSNRGTGKLDPTLGYDSVL
jgi:hypothetical protein